MTVIFVVRPYDYFLYSHVTPLHAATTSWTTSFVVGQQLSRQIGLLEFRTFEIIFYGPLCAIKSGVFG